MLMQNPLKLYSVSSFATLKISCLFFYALSYQSSSVIVCHKKQNKKIENQKRKISMKLFCLIFNRKR